MQDITNTRVAEKNTHRIVFEIRDEDGAKVHNNSLDSLTVSLYDRESGEIINSRENVSILNTNGGTYSNGDGTWTMDPLDNVIVSDSVEDGQEEVHVILFEYAYGTTKKGSQEHLVYVQKIAKRS